MAKGGRKKGDAPTKEEAGYPPPKGRPRWGGRYAVVLPHPSDEQKKQEQRFQRRLPFPTRAPEFWAFRDPAKQETPVQFAVRVYGEWMDGGFARRDLMHLDSGLYRALANWQARTGEDISDAVPTLKRMNDRLIDGLRAGTVPVPVDDAKALQRIASAMRRRQKP